MSVTKEETPIKRQVDSAEFEDFALKQMAELPGLLEYPLHVAVVLGKAGIGKTTLIREALENRPESLYFTGHLEVSDRLDIRRFHAQHHSIVVIDEIGQYSRESVTEAIVALTEHASRATPGQPTMLVLIAQAATDLEPFQAALPSQVMVIHLHESSAMDIYVGPAGEVLSDTPDLHTKLVGSITGDAYHLFL